MHLGSLNMGTETNTLDNGDARGFDSETFGQLREVFDFLDRDRNGSVSLDEVSSVIDSDSDNNTICACRHTDSISHGPH